MEVTKEDLKDFLLWLDSTGDDLDEELIKHDVKETFRECYGVDLSDQIGWMISRTSR